MAEQNLRARELTLEGLNRSLVSIQRQLEDLQRRPTFHGDIDMKGNRVTNVGRSKSRFDLTPRAELEEKALFENERGQHVAKSAVLASSFRSVKRARENDELVPLRQVREMIGTPSGVITTGAASQAINGILSIQSLALPSLDVPVTNLNSNHNVLLGVGGYSFVRPTGATLAFGISGFIDNDTNSGAITDGRLLIILNRTGQNMTILNDTSGFSLAPYRIKTMMTGNAHFTTTGDGAVILLYSATHLRWHMIAAVS